MTIQTIDGWSGINRIRATGTATSRSYFNMPKMYVDGVWTLQNAYVTTGRTIKKRPGTSVSNNLESGTVGLVAAFGKLHTFYSQGSVTHANPLYVAHKLTHKTNLACSVVKINYATVFLEILYVVATFSDGSVQHHFLIDLNQAWQPNTVYYDHAVVSPNPPNGFLYQCNPGGSIATWTPNAVHNNGDSVIPTTPNGYHYVVTGHTGSPIQSSNTEPAWPTSAGQTVTEVRDPGTVLPYTPYVPPIQYVYGPFYRYGNLKSGGYVP